jgi:hypothetical protein
MKPITFTCTLFIPQSAEAICNEIADLSRWEEFDGYGLVPGIETASFEQRPSPDTMLGARIRAVDSDGSTHIEEIVEWQPGERVVMVLQDFSPPLGRVATHFRETWTFAPQQQGTLVSREVKMYARSAAARPFLWLISLFFRRAIAAHLRQIAR